MGMILIYGLIFLIIFSTIAIFLFVYSKKKKSKIALAISILMIALIVFALMTNTIDELSISKKDVVSDLSHINIELQDDFKIITNNVTGAPERIQETEIQVSQKDKDRIVNEIRNSKNFKSFANAEELKNDIDMEQFGTSDKVFNFKYPEFYSRETYTKIENYPTRLFLSVFDKNNIIKYQRIED